MKVLFLAAPFKAPSVRRMTEHFTATIQCLFLTPEEFQIAPNERNFLARLLIMHLQLHPRLFRMAKQLRAALGLAPVRTFAEAVRKLKPDVIWTDNASYLDILTEEGVKISTVVCLRGNVWREAKTADSAYVKRAQRGLERAAIVTPVCSWLDRELKEQLPEQRTRVIYQGMAAEEWYPVPPLELQHPAVAIIQNHNILPKVQGLLHFHDVIAAMPDVHFYISRGQYATYFPLIEERFQDLRNIEYVTANTPDQVRELLSSVDAYVLASGLDCCPYTVLEAGLMGRPVIASDVGGVPEIVREGVTGFTVHNGNVVEWASRIREALASEWPLTREFVAENFGWSHIAPQIEEAIREAKA